MQIGTKLIAHACEPLIKRLRGREAFLTLQNGFLKTGSMMQAIAVMTLYNGEEYRYGQG